MNRPKPSRGNKRVVSAALRAVDIWGAILLLTGQITVGGVFISSGAIWLSATGPVFGGSRIEGTTASANALVDGVDVVTALLLILGQITNTGPWISSGRFNLVFSGPAFGNPNIPVAASPSETSAQAESFYSAFCQELIGSQIAAQHRT